MVGKWGWEGLLIVATPIVEHSMLVTKSDHPKISVPVVAELALGTQDVQKAAGLALKSLKSLANSHM